MNDHRYFNKAKATLHEILLTNLQNLARKQQRGGKRKRLLDFRCMLHCLIKIDHCSSKIKCGSYRTSTKKARTAAACPCFW